jgi:16S rRNA (adenine1518-N6/adenine1519-N6)-dimethyltransferase
VGRSAGLRPRKRFGQHFLQDSSVLARIADAVDPRAGERIVEIGPGRGALTRMLLERIERLEAIEIDRDLARELASRYDPARLVMIEADVLDVDFTALRGAGDALRLVGNLPYNISTPLLFHLLAHRGAIQDMHFMLQREVVERMAAIPGTKAYGRLTVMLAPWVTVEPLFTVPAAAFRPPPKVESAVVRLLPAPAARFDIGEPRRFERVVRAAFAQRRKTLRNGLRGVVSQAAFEQLHIDPGERAERLSPQQFAELARCVD